MFSNYFASFSALIFANEEGGKLYFRLSLAYTDTLSTHSIFTVVLLPDLESYLKRKKNLLTQVDRKKIFRYQCSSYVKP